MGNDELHIACKQIGPLWIILCPTKDPPLVKLIGEIADAITN